MIWGLFKKSLDAFVVDRVVRVFFFLNSIQIRRKAHAESINLINLSVLIGLLNLLVNGFFELLGDAKVLSTRPSILVVSVGCIVCILFVLKSPMHFEIII